MIVTLIRAHWADNQWGVNAWAAPHWFRLVETVDTDTAPRTCLLGEFVPLIGLEGSFTAVTPLVGSWPACSG